MLRKQSTGDHRLAFYAQLASMADLNMLKKKEQKAVEKAARRAGFRFTQLESVDRHWEIIRECHADVYRTIHAVLDRLQVSLKPLAQEESDQVLLGKNHRLQAVRVHTRASLRAEIKTGLYMLLKQEEFPLRRCPHCKVGVFVAAGRRKYCSRTCTTRAVYLRRKDDPKRHDDVLRNMRRYHAKKRAAAAEAIV